MASFLQNNGDIILDAVLTDYGRKLLAKGDGSFNIVKFALGDDEIDYGLFDPTLGTVNQDTAIMNTPILEAFTNNAASVKSQLLTIGMQNMLYMPVMVVNTNLFAAYTDDNFNGYVVPVSTQTVKTIDALTRSISFDVGVTSARVVKDGVVTDSRYVYIDQGLDSPETDQTKTLKGDVLYETAYNVYVDSRFGMIPGQEPLSIDDDGIAVYKFTEQSNLAEGSGVTQIEYKSDNSANHIIRGTQGSRLRVNVAPSMNLYTDTYFNRYGKELLINVDQPDKVFKTLRSHMRVVGVTTGYTLDIPLMFAKLKVS